MRVPERVDYTINAYFAAKAALMEAVSIGIESIVFPGMGTGVGCMDPRDCARQVNAAINDVIVNERAYDTLDNLYDEQRHMVKHIVSNKWMKVQYET